jgi:hypothetical protein
MIAVEGNNKNVRGSPFASKTRASRRASNIKQRYFSLPLFTLGSKAEKVSIHDDPTSSSCKSAISSVVVVVMVTVTVTVTAMVAI